MPLRRGRLERPARVTQQQFRLLARPRERDRPNAVADQRRKERRRLAVGGLARAARRIVDRRVPENELLAPRRRAIVADDAAAQAPSGA